jgi:hypothetical protein
VNPIFPPSKENPFYTRNDLPIIQNAHLSPLSLLLTFLFIHHSLTHAQADAPQLGMNAYMNYNSDAAQLFPITDLNNTEFVSPPHSKYIVNVNVGGTKYTNISCTV